MARPFDLLLSELRTIYENHWELTVFAPFSQDVTTQKIESKPLLHGQGLAREKVPIIQGSNLYYMLSEARVAAQTDYVIEHNGKPVKTVRRGIEVAGQRVGIDYLTPHILKHSACVWMAEDGVPLADIADLTVTDIKTIMDNYMIFTPARGQRAVSATQFWLHPP